MLDDFITKVQVEEIYDETQLQELHEFYNWLNTEHEKELDQSGREGLCEDSSVR